MNCREIRNNLPALISGELDAQTAAEVRRHVEECGECAAVLQECTRADETLRAVGIQQMPAETEAKVVSTLESVRGTRQRVRWLPMRPIWVLGSALLVVTVLMVGMLLTWQPKASAAQVIAQAKERMNGLKSWHVKMENVVYQPGGGTSTSYFESWYSAPDKFRDDISADGVGTFRTPAVHTTRIARGRLEVFYQNDGQAILESPPGKKVANLIFPMVTSPKEVLDRLGPGSRLAGTELVVGRTCDVVESADASDAAGSAKENWISVRVCVDRKTGIALKYTKTLGGKPWLVSTAKTLDVDGPVADSVFDPKLPAGKPIIRAPFQGAAMWNLTSRVLGEKTPPDLDARGQTMSLKSLGTLPPIRDCISVVLRNDAETDRKREIAGLYAPDYFPSRFKLLSVHVKPAIRRTAKSLTYDSSAYRDIEVVYVDPKTGDSLILLESADKWGEEGEPTMVGGSEGKPFASDEPFPHVVLRWEKNGVYFTLGAVNVKTAELVRVAESMRSVEGPAPIPATGSDLSNLRIEFYWLKDYRSPGNPTGRWSMMEPRKDKEGRDSYSFFAVRDQVAAIGDTTAGREWIMRNIINAYDPVKNPKGLKPVFTSSELLPQSKAQMADRSGWPSVSVQFSEKGRKASAEFTRKHKDEYLAVVLNGRMLSTPQRMELKPSGTATMRGTMFAPGGLSYPNREAQKLADALNAAAKKR